MKTNDKIVKDVTPEVDEMEEETPLPMRQIIIETDGTNIHLIKADVSGKIELMGVLQGLIGFLNQNSDAK